MMRRFPQGAVHPDEIEQHCLDIAKTEGIVSVYPNWWEQPPVIMNGWIDRVIHPGIADEFLESDSGEGMPNGLFKAPSAIVFNASNTATTREKQDFGNPLDRIWKDCVFALCKVKHFHRRMFNIMVLSTLQQRAQWLNEIRQLVGLAFKMPRGDSRSVFLYTE